MEKPPLITPTIDLLILPVALVFFLSWLVYRRKTRKEKIKASKLEKKKYSTSQMFGIAGILVFILPIFWAVGVMLQKGLFVLFILLTGWIDAPIVIIVLKTIFAVSTLFLLFTGVYLVCEFTWPNRYVAKIEPADGNHLTPDN